MSSESPRATEILDVAEALVRTQGYNGFSFRDVAAAVGIKSASVHYHFPTKADLGAEVARRYADRFIDALGDPADPEQPPTALLARYIAAFRHALVQDGQMCLCGMLGAEIGSLPVEVAGAAKGFFNRNVAWLEAVLSRTAAAKAGEATTVRARALAILATVEGAMIVARTLRQPGDFDRIADVLTDAYASES